MWHALFMATLEKGSSLGEEPNAKTVLGIDALNLHKPSNFSSHPPLLSVSQSFPFRVSFFAKSYQGETDQLRSQFPYELLVFCVTIIMKCVLSFRCVGDGGEWRIPVENIKSSYPKSSYANCISAPRPTMVRLWVMKYRTCELSSHVGWELLEGR